jgi:hypothetical protein
MPSQLLPPLPAARRAWHRQPPAASERALPTAPAGGTSAPAPGQSLPATSASRGRPASLSWWSGALLAAGLLAAGAPAAASAGRPAMTPLRPLHSDPPACQSLPLLVPRPDLSTLVAWRDWTFPGPERTRVRRLGPQGAAVGQVAETLDFALQAASSGAAGEAILVVRQGAGLPPALATLAADGSLAGTPQPLPLPADAHRISIARRPSDGRLLLAWTAAQVLWLQLFDATGLPLTTARALGPTGPGEAAVGFSTGDRAFAVWPQGSTGSSHLALQWLSATTGEPGGPLQDPTADLAGTRNDQPTAVALASGGLALAWVHVSSPGNTATVVYRLLGPAGQPFGPATPVDDAAGARPRLAAGPDGALALGWQRHNADRYAYDPVLRLLAGPGAGAGILDLHPENPIGTGVDNSSPELAYLTDGRLVAVWSGFFVPAILPVGCENLGIYARVLDPAPRRAGLRANTAPFLAGTTTATASHPAALALGEDGRWLVAWQDRPCGALRGRLLAPTDAPLGPTRELAELPCEVADIGVRAAALEGGGFVLAWMEGLGWGPLKLLRLDPDGRPLGAAFTAIDTPASAPRLVRQRGGGFVLGWVEPGGLRLQRFSAAALPVAAVVSVTESPPTERFWDLLAISDGGLVVAWNASPATILAQRLRADGSRRGDVLEVVEAAEPQVGPHLAPAPGGGFAVAWTAFGAPLRFGAAARLQRFGPDGRPHGNRLTAAELVQYQEYDDYSSLLVVDLATSTDGTHWLTYRRTDSWDRLEAVAVAGSQLLGPATVLETDDRLLVAGESLAADCTFLTVWKEPGTSSGRVVAQRFAGGCLDEPTTLGLRGGRFTVRARWQLPDGRQGDARGWSLGRDSAALWFFDPENPELFVKLLDGGPINGSFWLFTGALTSAAVDLELVDTTTGARRAYRKEPGSPASTVDLDAFPSPPGATATRERPLLGSWLAAPGQASEKPSASGSLDTPGDRSAVAAPPATWPRHEVPTARTMGDTAAGAPPPCGASAAASCLLADRYRVEVHFTDPRSGAVHPAVARPVGADGLGFWFFRADALEVLVKVLDGRGVNGHHWVFHAGLSNLAYEIVVTDTASGATWRYQKARGALDAGADTTAFPLGSDLAAAP